VQARPALLFATRLALDAAHRFGAGAQATERNPAVAVGAFAVRALLNAAQRFGHFRAVADEPASGVGVAAHVAAIEILELSAKRVDDAVELRLATSIHRLLLSQVVW
jgi:hypothetical protein